MFVCLFSAASYSFPTFQLRTHFIYSHIANWLRIDKQQSYIIIAITNLKLHNIINIINNLKRIYA